jgi:hypothetical protein
MPPWGTLATRSKRTPAPVSDRPPAGFYDPSLDAQQRASGRGLSDLLADTTTAGSRAESDYQLGNNQLKTTAGRSLADLLRGNQREGQDYSTSLADLSRSFQRLGQSQAQSAASKGLGQGALAAAMKARTANEAIKRQPLDTAHQRAGEDYTTQTGRVNEDLSSGLAENARQYQYGVDDRATDVGRAQRENLFFGQDIGAQKLFQAGQAGWTIPKRRK